MEIPPTSATSPAPVTSRMWGTSSSASMDSHAAAAPMPSSQNERVEWGITTHSGGSTPPAQHSANAGAVRAANSAGPSPPWSQTRTGAPAGMSDGASRS